MSGAAASAAPFPPHHAHDGEPRGSVGSVGSLPAYITHPPSGDGAPPSTERMIVILTDVFGHLFRPTHLVADQLAAESGMSVVVPDILKGDAIPPTAFGPGSTFSIDEWFSRHPPEEAQALAEGAVGALRGPAFNAKKVAAIGYCFGGRFSILLAGGGGGKAASVEAFAAAHPSRVQVPADIEAIAAPGIFLFAETDSSVPPEKAAAIADIVAKKGGAGGPRFEIHHFPGTNHGFAIRGDASVAVVRQAKSDAISLAAAFFKSALA